MSKSALLTPLLVAFFALAACGGGGSTGESQSSGRGSDAADREPLQTRYGVLSFRVSHNVQDASCLEEGDCFYETNQEAGIQDWLWRVRQDSDLAVLHWNRPIPYATFAVDPPEGMDRVAFYDERLAPLLVNWVDAFADHFEQMPRGYLAVSGLNSRRTRPAPSFTGEQEGTPITSSSCPALSPGATFEVTGPGGETQTIDYEHAYTNFLLYLYEKLEPEEVGLFVEANLFKENCPKRWEGFVDLYHSIYESFRDEAGSSPRLFTSLTYLDLLNYDLERCTGGAQVESCDGAVGSPSYGDLDAQQCYEVDTSPIEALNEGGRLDVLALSAYPDGLRMSVPGGGQAVEFHPPSSSGREDCQQRLIMPPVVNPWDQLDRLNWDKPIAISETSARSCPVWNWFDNPDREGLLRIPGSPKTQRYWLNRALEVTKNQPMAFMVQSLYEDYPPVGRPFLQNVDNPPAYNAINLWPCSGLYTQDGSAKTGVLSRWRDAVQ